MTILFLTLVAALLLDRLLGEPRYAHPLVGFGRLVSWLEKKFNSIENGWGAHNAGSPSGKQMRLKPHLQLKQKLRGILAVAILTLPFTGLLLFVSQWQAGSSICKRCDPLSCHRRTQSCGTCLSGA